MEEIEIIVDGNDNSGAPIISNPQQMIKCKLLLATTVPGNDAVQGNSVIYNEFPVPCVDLSDIRSINGDYEVKQGGQHNVNRFKCILNFEYSLNYDISSGKFKITFGETIQLIDKVDAIIQWRRTTTDRGMIFAKDDGDINYKDDLPPLFRQTSDPVLDFEEHSFSD